MRAGLVHAGDLGAQVVLCAEAKACHAAACVRRRGERLGVVAVHEEAVGDLGGEAGEHVSYVVEGRVDVDVVVLHVVDRGRGGRVVPELGDLVEVGRVVLIAFDDEEPALAEAVVGVQLAQHTAEEEGGVAPCLVQRPGAHRGGRAFAVRAGHDEPAVALKEEEPQRLGEAHHRQPSLTRRHGFGVVDAGDVPDHDQLCVGRDMFGSVARLDDEPALLQPRAHRRVGHGVGAPHA